MTWAEIWQALFAPSPNAPAPEDWSSADERAAIARQVAREARTEDEVYADYCDALMEVLEWARKQQRCGHPDCESEHTTMEQLDRVEEMPLYRALARCADCGHEYALNIDEITAVGMAALREYDRAFLFSELDDFRSFDTLIAEQDDVS